MMIGFLPFLLLQAAQEPNAAQTDLAFGCVFGSDDAPSIMLGRIGSVQGRAKNFRETFIEIVRDDSGRYEGKTVVGPGVIRLRSGSYYLFLDRKNKEGLFLDFSDDRTSGAARLIQGDYDNPVDTAHCTFRQANT